jgi:hypothetical protein
MHGRDKLAGTFKRLGIAFAVIDTVFASAFVALTGWLFYASHTAAATATRDYGHNVDSGAIESIVAGYYCGPVAVAFGVAAAALYRDWRIKWYLHWLAVLIAVVPGVLVGVP